MAAQDTESEPAVNDKCWFMQIPIALQPFPSSRLALLARVPPTSESLLETIYVPGTGLDMPAPSSITVLPYPADGPASSPFRFSFLNGSTLPSYSLLVRGLTRPTRPACWISRAQLPSFGGLEGSRAPHFIALGGK